MPIRRISTVLLLGLALCVWPRRSQAADDTAEFLDAMRAAGHYELALEYLDLLEQPGRADPAVRERIPYERAVTQLEHAQTLSSQSAREAAVNNARRDLKAFTEANQAPRLVAEANAKLAGVLINGAGRRAAAAERLSAGERNAEIERARTDIQESRRLLDQAEASYEEALEPLKSVQPGSPEAQQRLQLRFQLAQSRLSNARALNELAKTYPSDSNERKQLLEKAAKDFAALYEKYDTQQSAGIGFYAHLYEGRCYQELGQHRLADGCFEVVASLPTEDPSLRRLVRMAQTSLVAGLTAQDEAGEALERGAEWLDDIPRKEQSQPAVLALKYELGRAAITLADAATDKGKTEELRRQARDLFADASRGFNEHQSDARLKLVALNDQLGAGQVDAATFQEAYQMGVDALNAVFATQLAARTGQDDAGGDSAQQERLRALALFRQALRLADSETPLPRLNDARNKLSYLYWETGDYLSCAALAEFLATKHPSDPAAEGATKLAMAAFEKLRIEAEQSGESTDFASDHMVRLCKFVTQRWAGSPLADSAFSVLLSTAIRDNRLDDARTVLENVPAERRAPLELRLALAGWEQAARSGASASPAERRRAANDLESALNAVTQLDNDVDVTAITGALFLAQARLSDGAAADAVKLLEDRQIGPLALAKQGARTIADNPGLKAEAYRTALQAYLSMTPPRTADAMNVMGELESAVEDKQALTRIFFALGVQLQRQIEELQQAGKTADAQRVSGAFAEFVARIGEADTGGDWTMQQWMAQTYLRLGEGLEGDADDAQRKQFFERARDGFRSLAERAASDPSSAPSPTSSLAVRMQLGAAQKGLGEYDKAIETFAGLLEEREMMLDVQKLAAYTLQEWGQQGDAGHLQDSIRGARPSVKTGKNLIWGWSKLASVSGKVARSKPEYRDLFFESWLNVATSRYLAGMKASGDQQQRQFASARKTILLLSRQYSDLGGEERRTQFDTLLKKIQRAEGEKPVGLSEFTSAAPTKLPQRITLG
ncbi:hypothetical protein Pla123a_40650 [Posidoniimonas polymericola]|uniref:Tetratricopeptide repeat protein n=1 Tax=Posidoniimonas polymericola TaxID=2528002 RepID=A0A5C5YAN5_9BACT|nr:hypothetical protein [Posidoniimonas polymericola]TWT72766.1 hypothetical protein Pla123a_40650 [Posidoniimonas polymericola]